MVSRRTPSSASWVTAARRFVEDKAGRQFVTATARLTLDRFPFTCSYQWLPSPERRTIVVPRAPLQSVTSIAYVDAGGDTQTLSANSYRVDVRVTVGPHHPRLRPDLARDASRRPGR
jgi:hypothetical protein